MTTAMISTPAEKYLEAVQRGLADLPAEDIEEVIQDLAAHIAELGEGNPEASLGSPDAFIAEFRASAGLDSVGARSPGRARTWLAERLAATTTIVDEGTAPTTSGATTGTTPTR